MSAKIVHIINNIDRGGAETLLLSIIPGVRKRLKDSNITVLILENKTALIDDFTRCGIEVELVDVFGQNPLKQINAVRKKIKNLKPDIVHTHLLFADRVGQISAFLAGIKNRVSTLHSLDAPQSIKEKIQLKVSSFFTQEAIAVSESVKQFNISNHLYKSSKIRVIYNAPSFTLTHVKDTTPKDSERTKFISLGRLHHLKEYASMINAVKLVIDQGRQITLDIFGAGNLEDSLQSEIVKLGLSQNVYLRGLTNNVQEKLYQADYYISASSVEGQPLSVIEALSVGLPFVITSIPSHLEMLGNIEYEYLAEPKNPYSLAQAIIRILDEKDYQKLSTLSLQLSKKYNQDTMLNDYTNLYKTMIGNK